MAQDALQRENKTMQKVLLCPHQISCASVQLLEHNSKLGKKVWCYSTDKNKVGPGN